MIFKNYTLRKITRYFILISMILIGVIIPVSYFTYFYYFKYSAAIALGLIYVLYRYVKYVVFFNKKILFKKVY